MLHYVALHYTTLHCTRLHYCIYTTLQLQLQLTTKSPLHYNGTTPPFTTSSSCGWGDHCNHCNHSKKHNSNHLSVHQWIRSAICDSQQLTSPIGFLFLKLPPPPSAVLLVKLVSIMTKSNFNNLQYLSFEYTHTDTHTQWTEFCLCIWSVLLLQRRRDLHIMRAEIASRLKWISNQDIFAVITKATKGCATTNAKLRFERYWCCAVDAKYNGRQFLTTSCNLSFSNRTWPPLSDEDN